MELKNNVIQIKDVAINIDGKIILDQLNLSVSKAEFIYLVGKSGAGKSSLMKMMFGMIPFSKGEATIAGFNLKTLALKDMYQLRRNVSMIFQDFKLFDQWTVQENLAYVLKATEWEDALLINQRIEEVLSLTNMESKINEKVHNLSGGEQQKIAISRAILNKPKLLLADEPTGNLDQEAAESIIHLFYKISAEQKTTVFLTTHHHNILTKFPGRMIHCDENTIYE